jgi:hypothetical protein
MVATAVPDDFERLAVVLVMTLGSRVAANHACQLDERSPSDMTGHDPSSANLLGIAGH